MKEAIASFGKRKSSVPGLTDTLLFHTCNFMFSLNMMAIFGLSFEAFCIKNPCAKL